MVKVKTIRTGIKIRCDKCGVEGELIIKIKYNSIQCYIDHGNEKRKINDKTYYRRVLHYISCFELEQKGINVRKLINTLESKTYKTHGSK